MVWVVLDACRAKNLSVYGYRRPTTPHLERLAERGTVFEQHFAQAPTTVPSVASYMTGRYFPVNCCNVPGWERSFRVPPEGERLLPWILDAKGYHSKLVSATPWITKASRLWQFFREADFIKPARKGEVYATFASINEIVIPWIASRPPQPFFLYLHAMDTHGPHRPPEEFNRWAAERHDSDQVDFAKGTPVHKSGKACFSATDRAYLEGLYDGSICYADHHIAAILAVMDAQGLTENTLFLVSADHGDAWGEDGTTWGHPMDLTADEVTHIPLIIAGPGILQGKRVASLTENADIFPTLVQLLKIDSRAQTNGKSLVPLLNGAPDVPPRAFAFTKSVGHQRRGIKLSLRTNHHRYECETKHHVQHLWAVPDSLAARRDAIADFAPDAARLRAHIEGTILPLLEAHDALPRGKPYLPFVERIPDTAKPPDAFTHESKDEDGKWRLAGGVLEASAQEDVPPITIEIELPDGAYAVQVLLKGGARIGRVSVDGHETTVGETANPGGTARFLPISACTVTGGRLNLLIDDLPGQAASLGMLRFVPAGAGGLGVTPEEAGERAEQIRALGYL